ncbi:MAG: Ig-like domain-containing protein [Bryobacteraceae bacterium]
MQAFPIALAVLMLPLAGTAESVFIMKDGVGYKVVGWQPGPTAPAGGWSSIFAVYAGADGVPPMLGSYNLEQGTLVFRPRFPPAPGVRTRALLRRPGASPIEAVFEEPKADAQPSTNVRHVYPSTDLLPANQLKFYIHFSAPMRRGEAWQRIHLLDQNGARVDLPFLEIDQELWDRDYTRLTVLFDPGRIKRGLFSLEQAGPAIEEGKQYTLVIDQEWLDAAGAPLERPFRKSFRVVPPDRVPLDPREWHLSTPQAGTSGALILEFPKPVDHALLLRLLDVAGPDGRVAGAVEVDREETRWRFVPNEPWKSVDYNLVIGTSIEDLAGNRIGRAFDVDLFDPVTKRLARKTISLPFRPGRH